MTDSERLQLFQEWLGRHRGLIFKVVRAHARAASDQDDLFQEIATQLWNSLPRYRGESAETTWIYRVALNTALAWSRRAWREQRRSEEMAQALPALTSATKPDPRLEWLYEQLAQLESVDRALALLLLDGLSYREMSETLGLSESHIGVRLHRLKQQLSQLAQAHFRHEP
ncbi:MAG: sigma-70 family RNA polymerase sigma factor [Verrucomicrobia bacterium]|nr:sigma-70 family RNA polymerase sigma factor [Verrucomicrobiota bacterium]